MTPAEIAALKAENAKLQQERDHYRKAHIESTIRAHAAKHNAKQPDDLLVQLAPTVRLAHGELTAEVDGKRMEIPEAIEAMAKTRKHLFGEGTQQEAGKTDLAKLAEDPVAYEKWAEKNIDKR